MENLSFLTICDDGSCCCLSSRWSVAIISIISLVACILDVASNDSTEQCCIARAHVVSLRCYLLSLFQMANTLLLLGSIVENALLLQIYLWYALAFIMIGFVVVILEFLYLPVPPPGGHLSKTDRYE
ncbi:unnamed protein product [Leptidea sinapis]|uniref:Uncharacterized protein n=1 Tax=Leptidea sinapis TaxID=189913 RepID=A0A5E4QPZ6_9NEOP|nr:unnamed protein product [Leptidea sinapis]